MRRRSEDILVDPPPPVAAQRLAYGAEPKQFADLRLPAGDRSWPLAIVLHGGFWKATYNLIHTGHLCLALAGAGIASWNVEYRAVGDPGGDWPGAADDVARAVEFAQELATRFPLEAERVVLVGHSAGGQLGLWAASRAGIPVVALAAVSDLRECAERGGPAGDVARFLGGMPAELPGRYAEASPLELLPLGVRQIVVHGDSGEDVDYGQSVRYAEAAGDEAELVTLAGAGHFEPIDPLAREWPQVLAAIGASLG
ncbi:MAG TPA: alpha/beta hydrolase [Gaiellaceae bacterium]